MKGLKKLNVMAFAAFLLMASGCRDVAVPKPKGHFRIDLPEKKYVRLRDQHEKPGMPFSFEFPEYGILSFEKERADDQGWFNIEFPAYRAKIYLTYKEINNNFSSLMEQTYRMNVRNHMAKADAINEQAFNNQGDRVFGILYDLKGNTATAVQFYATDSVKHYLRGSLYFSAEPDADSLAPVIEFFRKDIIHLIETLEWGM